MGKLNVMRKAVIVLFGLLLSILLVSKTLLSIDIKPKKYFCHVDYCENGHTGLNGDIECLPIGRPNKVVYLLHGMGGSYQSFSILSDNLYNIAVNNNYYIHMNIVLTNVNSNISKTDLKWILNLRGDLDEDILIIPINFTDNKDYVDNQVNEFDFIKRHVDYYLDNPSTDIIGYSKGGLVAIAYSSYSTINTLNPVARIFTLGTPYSYVPQHSVGNIFVGDSTIGDMVQMAEIQAIWNNNAYNVETKVVAIAFESYWAIWSFSWSDFLIETRNASGQDYNNVIPLIINKQFDDRFHHDNFLNQYYTAELVYNLLKGV